MLDSLPPTLPLPSRPSRRCLLKKVFKKIFSIYFLLILIKIIEKTFVYQSLTSPWDNGKCMSAKGKTRRVIVSVVGRQGWLNSVGRRCRSVFVSRCRNSVTRFVLLSALIFRMSTIYWRIYPICCNWLEMSEYIFFKRFCVSLSIFFILPYSLSRITN